MGGLARCGASDSVGRAVQRNTLEGAAGFVGADVGDDHGCVIRGDGMIFCWGNNNFGQLGLGSTSPSTQPTLAQASATGSLIYPISVAAGGNHSCAVDINGTVQCWGANSNGQLGNGNTTDQLAPVVFQIPSGRRARQVSAGYTFTCALLDDNTVWCAGAGSSGQLGNNSTSSSSTPVQVQLSGTGTSYLENVVEITTGDFHACALATDGYAYCWGAAMGNGSTNQETRAVYAANSPLLRSISAAGTTTCGVTAGGEVTCWGANADGELGDGTTTSRATAATVSNLTNIAAVGVGVFHACAVKADGTLTCWGKNGNGQVGNGTTSSPVTSPAAVSFSSNPVLGVLGGFAHTCALSASGLYCWGSDSAGQLGNGTTLTGNQTTPTLATLPPYQDLIAPYTFVDTASTFQRGRILDVGANHTCMVVPAGSFVNVSSSATSDGASSSRVSTASVACWGQNGYGQLGTGNTTPHNRPRWVSGLPAGPKAVATGANHSCALIADGTVRCWGRNNVGQLGDGTTTDRTSSVQVSGVSYAIAIAAGDEHTCALIADGSIKCWGKADDHRLGNGEFVTGGAPPTGARTSPQTVRRCSCTNDCNCDSGSGPWDGSLTTADANIAITAGGAHTCAIRADGTAWCWGRNTMGQIGRVGDISGGTNLDVDYVRFAKRVEFGSVSTYLQRLLSISAGSEHTCGVNAYGTAYCWGRDDNQQVSTTFPTGSSVCRWNGSTAVDVWCTPVDNSGRLSGVHAVSAGGDTTCALRNTATSYSEAFCWGQNADRQAGSTSTTYQQTAQQIVSSFTPDPVPVLDRFVRIVTSNSRSCGLEWNGAVRCWGLTNTGFGELGRGANASSITKDPEAKAVVDLGV